MGLCISQLNFEREKQGSGKRKQWYKMSPRIVLITGCSTGIGRATAISLAQDPEKSFKVYATMRNLDKRGDLEQAAGECFGTTLFIETLDVCSDESVTEIVEKILAREGRIDILVNNAGVSAMGIMELMPMEIVRNVFETNFFGTMRMIRAVTPHMKSRMEGHIVNVSSVYGLMGCPFNEFYTASKFAVEGFSEAIGPVLEEFNIRLSLVQPGPVKTAILQRGKELREKLDFSRADERSKELLTQTVKKVHNDFQTKLQSSEEVADLIKAVLQAQKPSFRNLTNDNFAPNVFGAKFADMSGDDVIRKISQRFLHENNN